MAVPRPVLLAIIGMALLASAFLATRGGSTNSVTPQTAAKPAPAHKAAPQQASSAGSRAARRAKPARAARPAAARPKPGAAPAVPANVREAAVALSRDEVVVFFFSKPGAADDTGTRVAMRALDGMRHVKVFRAGVDDLAAYRPMLSGLGISQVPATAIVRPGKRAVLIEGFVDAGTLRQNVADARR